MIQQLQWSQKIDKTHVVDLIGKGDETIGNGGVAPVHRFRCVPLPRLRGFHRRGRGRRAPLSPPPLSGGRIPSRESRHGGGTPRPSYALTSSPPALIGRDDDRGGGGSVRRRRGGVR